MILVSCFKMQRLHINYLVSLVSLISFVLLVFLLPFHNKGLFDSRHHPESDVGWTTWKTVESGMNVTGQKKQLQNGFNSILALL